MNKTIREASTYLAGLLPPDSDFYSTDDLSQLGMPDFIVRRIAIDVADKLAKSLAPPASEWFDTEKPSVKTAWNQFVEQARMDARLPRKHAADIIDNAVIETVELIVAPRRRVVEWIFGPSTEVSISTVRQRSQYVTINRYLTDALIRYMERKELQVITRAAAVEVVRSVDERYVSGFTPLSWAQLIYPLFQISRNRVDSELIHDFFVDKDRDELANLFPETSSRMERVQLIERLTVGHAPKKATKEQTKSQPVESHDEVELISEPPIIEPPAVVMEPEPDKEPSTLLSSLSDELEASEPEVSPSFAVNTEETPSATVVPIWQQFLNDVPDEADDVPDDVVTPPFAESLFEAEPQAAATVASSLHSVGLQKAKLVDWLKTDENAYIEDLFNGNEMEYFRTVAELEACSDWDGVQSILKGWVRSSDIDLHNAQLAQLVDQLQIYFSTNDS